MKRNDTGEWCVLYLEPSDERSTLLNAIVGQRKPVVVMLSEQAHVMWRPDDYAALKKMKRQHDVPVLFVIPESNWGRRTTHVATRAGFSVYPSIDALMQSQERGRVARTTQRLAQEAGQSAHRPARPHSQQASFAFPTSPVIAPAVSLPDTAPLHPIDPTTPTPRLARGFEEDAEDEPTQPPVAPGTTQTQASYRSHTRQRVQAKKAPGDVAPSMSPRRTRDLSPEMVDAMLDARVSSYTASSLPTQPVTPAAPAAPAQSDTPTSPPSGSHPAQRPRRNRFPTILIFLTLLMLLGAGLGYVLLLFHPLTNVVVAPVAVGHLRFLSSEQLSENSSQGIDDELQLDLSNVSGPAPQKSYYAWLLADQSVGEGQALLLGTLPVHNASVHFFYPGDAQHTNLLINMSRLLITEESATVPPIAPSPDDSTWRYYGAFSTTLVKGTDTQGNAKQFSYLDHLRHLLASDPMLNQMELPGGLSNWLYRNTGKILEWTSSMREHWEETPDVTFLQRQTIRTLAYLDGLSYVRGDVPTSIPLGINDRLASVGILEVDGTTQNPPAYLDHIVTHLNGLLQASTTTGTVNEQLRKNVAAVIDALSNVRLWLTKVRQDGQQLLKMSDTQLHQPQTLSLLNDMIANATAAYAGQPDPNTGEMYQGVTWIHSQLQTLATLDIVKYDPKNSNVQMIQDMRHRVTGIEGVRATMDDARASTRGRPDNTTMDDAVTAYSRGVPLCSPWPSRWQMLAGASL